MDVFQLDGSAEKKDLTFLTRSRRSPKATGIRHHYRNWKGFSMDRLDRRDMIIIALLKHDLDQATLKCLHCGKRLADWKPTDECPGKKKNDL